MVDIVGLGIFIVIIILLAIILGIASFVFWILMVIDAAKRGFKNSNEKVVWIIVIVLLGALGALIYYFAVSSIFLLKNCIF